MLIYVLCAFIMDGEDMSQAKYLSAIWLILGLIIFTGNILTSYILWLSKVSREKLKLGSKIHALWNLICIYLAFSLVGLSLFINMVILLARNSGVSSGFCNFLAFLYTFGFNFAVIGILVGLMDRTYNIFKPFDYHAYVSGKSKVPMVIFVCGTLYGVFMGILPLTRLGNYYQSMDAICMMKWDQESAVRITASFNIIIFLIIVMFIFVNIWQMCKIYQKRRRMKVSTTRRKETLVFILLVSSLFLLCWCPYMIAMLVSTISSGNHPGERGVSMLFGVTLVPLLVSPVLAYVLHGHYQDECKRIWACFQQYFASKPKSKIRKTTTSREETEMGESSTVGLETSTKTVVNI